MAINRREFMARIVQYRGQSVELPSDFEYDGETFPIPKTLGEISEVESAVGQSLFDVLKVEEPVADGMGPLIHAMVCKDGRTYSEWRSGANWGDVLKAYRRVHLCWILTLDSSLRSDDFLFTALQLE